MIRIRTLVGVAVASALVILLVAPGAGARPSAATATTVTVKMKEFKFTLSRRAVPRGKVTFIVINTGRLNHDFKIKGKKTASIRGGKRTRLVITFLRKGSFAYQCTIDSHARLGMKGTLRVT